MGSFFSFEGRQELKRVLVMFLSLWYDILQWPYWPGSNFPFQSLLLSRDNKPCAYEYVFHIQTKQPTATIPTSSFILHSCVKPAFPLAHLNLGPDARKLSGIYSSQPWCLLEPAFSFWNLRPWVWPGFCFFPVCFGDVGSSALPLPWIAQLKERNRRW